MARHVELNPDPRSLPLEIASEALSLARKGMTRNIGSVYVPNGDGTGTLIGAQAGSDDNGQSNGIAVWVNDTTIPGKPTNVSCYSVFGTVVVTWGGTLEGGIPADFSHVSVYVDDVEAGRLTARGNVVAWDMESGAKVQVTAVAYDNAHTSDGSPMPNASEPWGPVEITIVDERKQIDSEVEKINNRLDDMDVEAEQVQANIDAVRQEAQANFETAKNAADAAGQRADAAQQSVDTLRQETASEVQNVKDSVSGVRSDVDAVTQKAADLASELDGTKATVEQVVTEQGEIKSSVSNAVEKADQSLKVSTQASQTATQAQTTATSAYEDAQTAITQSSQATQTANQVSLDLKTNYQTKADADAKYATQASLTATSDQIRTEVSETYATQATVNALENLANNAVQTWMGDGVPSLSNKPASDWTTADLKSQHSGDLYYDTNTGYAYRFGSSDGTTYSWALIKDTDITKALADAAKAQETADGAQSGVNELKTSIPVTYATKSELSQKADSITARVEEVAQAGETTSSKVAELELTADGLQSTVKEQASKIDQNATTISQVSQKADSLSSTITQVSGRVDDVEDKADTAQGTANSALSQASRVEQSLDSFKTSVSRDYQTKTDALSQKSELEQNLNSFKTTVSETYTTKDEFDALEIGGTNLLPNTNQGTTGWSGSTNGGKVTITKNASPTKLVDYPQIVFDNIGSSWRFAAYKSGDMNKVRQTLNSSNGKEFTISFDAACDSTGVGKSISVSFREGDGTDNFIDFGSFSIPNVDSWNHYELTGKVSATPGVKDQVVYFQLSSFATVNGAWFKICNLKLEQGNKATPWSPAPEDFDGKYTSKTEFKQTTDKISATATAASQNASSALSKISSLEVSVDGIDTRVEEVASDADEAVKTASQVSQRVDSLSSTITQVSKDVQSTNSAVLIQNPGFETGDLTGWTADNWSNPRAEKFDKNMKGIGEYRFNGYAQQGTSNYSYLRSKAIFGAIPGKTYKVSVSALYADSNTTAYMLLRRISDNARSQITKTIGPSWTSFSGELTVPSDWGIGDNVRFEFAVQGISSGNNRILADDFSIVDVTDAKTANDTANSALSKSSSVEQNLNSFKTSVSQTYETKSDASSKQSSLQQSVNNLRTEVSQTYTTKSEFNDLQIGGTNLVKLGAYSFNSTVTNTSYSKTDDLYKFTVPANAGSNSDWRFGLNIHKGKSYVYAGIPWNHYGILSFYIYADKACTVSVDTNTQPWSGTAGTGNDHDTNRANSSYSIPANQWTQVWMRWQNANTNSSTGNPNKVDLYDCSTIGVLRQSSAINVQIKHIKFEEGTKPTDWSPCPADMLSSDQAAQTYSTKSYVDQTARTVSLGVVEEYKNGQHGSALATQSDITATKNSITSTVSQTYATKTDVSNTYLTKSSATATYATKTQVQQTSDSLTVKITESLNVANTAKTNAATAQSTADKANSNAQNAQNRVGNLETCIKMTSDGVRVGKISNGNFTGYSALVNSAGSYDILDSSGNAIVRFSSQGLLFKNGSNWNTALSIAKTYSSSSSLPSGVPERTRAMVGDDEYVYFDGKWRTSTYLVSSHVWNDTAMSPYGHIYTDLYYNPITGMTTVSVKYDSNGLTGFKPGNEYTLISNFNAKLRPAIMKLRNSNFWIRENNVDEIYIKPSGEYIFRVSSNSTSATKHYPRDCVSFPAIGGTWLTDDELGI